MTKKVSDKKAFRSALEEHNGDISKALESVDIAIDNSSLKWAKRLAKQWGYRRK